MKKEKTRRASPVRSDIAWSTHDRIGVMGYDLVNELIGKVNFGDMCFLMITGRLPNERESRMFNAMLVTSVEHGIVPSAIATRMTWAGAPESLQGAVAAGLLGLGTVFNGTTEGAAKLLKKALPDPRATVSLPDIAEQVVRERQKAGRAIPGIGHPIHKPIDPRAVRLLAIARAEEFSGKYVQLMELIQKKAESVFGKVLPMNSTGAKAAICCDMDLPPTITRGLGVISRAAGLVGHILEETRNPMALEIWHRIEHEASSHTRGRFRKPAVAKPEAGATKLSQARRRKNPSR
jgi:citrate synthase